MAQRKCAIVESTQKETLFNPISPISGTNVITGSSTLQKKKALLMERAKKVKGKVIESERTGTHSLESAPNLSPCGVCFLWDAEGSKTRLLIHSTRCLLCCYQAAGGSVSTLTSACRVSQGFCISLQRCLRQHCLFSSFIHVLLEFLWGFCFGQ